MVVAVVVGGVDVVGFAVAAAAVVVVVVVVVVVLATHCCCHTPLWLSFIVSSLSCMSFSLKQHTT